MKIIAAMSKNKAIGFKGKIPWDLKSDLRRFKQLTIGHPVIMGRKTFESIGRLLPDRGNVVITKNPDKRKEIEEKGAIAASSADEVREMFKERWEDVFVIGGGQVYRQFIKEADTIYLTIVDIYCKGDAYFPKVPAGFGLVSSEDCQDKLPYEFRVYRK